MAREAGGGELPEELVGQVLARLSGAPLFRCLAVCKAWHRLLSGSRDEVRMARRRLVLCSGYLAVAWQFHCGSKRWSPLPLAAVRGGPSTRWGPPEYWFEFCNYWEEFCAAAGGLLFLWWQSSNAARLDACDSSTGSLHLLPPMLSLGRRPRTPVCYDSCIFAASAPPAGPRAAIHAYKLVGLSSLTYSVQIFDSSTASWTHVADVPERMCRGMDNCAHQGLVALRHGELIFWGQDDRLWLLQSSRAVCLRRWTEIALPEVHKQCKFAYRVVRGDGERLLLVGARGFEEHLSHDRTLALESLHVWELDLRGRRWQLLGTMPSHLQEETSHSEGSVIRCVGVGERVCFYGLKELSVVEYHVPSDTWARLPPLVLDDNIVQSVPEHERHLLGQFFKGFQLGGQGPLF